jgi:hypothetical protein
VLLCPGVVEWVSRIREGAVLFLAPFFWEPLKKMIGMMMMGLVHRETFVFVANYNKNIHQRSCL